MQLRIREFIIAPDNGSTFSVSRIMLQKSTREAYVRAEKWPKDLPTAILRVRDELRKQSKADCHTLEQFVEEIRKIDAEMLEEIKKAVEGIRLTKPNDENDIHIEGA